MIYIKAKDLKDYEDGTHALITGTITNLTKRAYEQDRTILDITDGTASVQVFVWARNNPKKGIIGFVQPMVWHAVNLIGADTVGVEGSIKARKRNGVVTFCLYMHKMHINENLDRLLDIYTEYTKKV